MVISEVEQVAVCVACNLHIKDRYLFEVTNRKWHCVCLRCTHCKCLLTEKCWFRQNNLYCKDDYYKLFFSCNTCKQAIERDTYVRKTSSMIFHLQCFQCAQCGKVLDSGDHYIVNEDKLLCSSHYPNQLLSLSNSKNSLAELITDPEGEIVVKTEQSTLNSSLNTSIDNQPVGQQFAAGGQPNHPPFTSLSPPTSVLDSLTMSNAISQSHASSSPFLLSRSQQPPPPASSASLPNSIHHPTLDPSHPHHLHGDADRLQAQSLSLIDYSSHHQSSSIGKLTNSLTDFESTAADFYSPPSAACYPPNGQLPAHNPHMIGQLYEHEALRFYGGIQPPTSAPTPNSPLNEIENAHNAGPLNGLVMGGGTRKGRPRKRKQVGLTSSNNTGIDAISAALHEQNLNNLNSSTSSVIPQSLVNSINNGHLQNSNSSNSSTSSSNGNHQRTKRMRTSFKHSQLKMMKQYFGKNQNPDAKDLKALAQDTTLSKRVLQVWFQNQRAKYRRTNPNKCDGQFNQGLPLNQTLLGSPENGSTRQFSTPSPASIISNNSISNNQSSTMQCETSLPANHSATLCSNGSSSSLDQYSPSNSISLLRHTPPPSVKALQQPGSPSMAQLAPSALHFGHHLAGSHPSNALVNSGSMPNRHLTNFSSEQIMSTFQDLY